MDIKSSLVILKNHGYCLWVGNGVSMYLAQMSDAKLFGWEQLITKLESDCSVVSLIGLSYPERLDIIQRKMTSANFQKSLRKYIVDPLSESITAYVLRQMKESKATVPQEVTNLTTLGLLANPIINFNIEITTSRALVGGDSHFIIKSFVHPTLNDSTYFPRSYTQIENRFRRHVFHPHGALDLSGLCVLTDKEYESHSQTLGFQLAVHSAFGEILAIVGMSLEDEYLREQISKYRNHIRQIFWYVQDESSLDENVKKWVLKNDIYVISVDDWKIFWDDIGTVLPKPDEKIC